MYSGTVLLYFVFVLAVTESFYLIRRTRDGPILDVFTLVAARVSQPPRFLFTRSFFPGVSVCPPLSQAEYAHSAAALLK